MKRIITVILVVAMGCTTGLKAQKGKMSTGKQITSASTSEKNETQNSGLLTDTIRLQSTSTNQAFSLAPNRKFSIADPTILALKMRSYGVNVPISGSGIVGMPNGTYGFANGKIHLRKSAASSSGTSYGSGAVGTGTSIMGVGASENVLTVNGKSPYAGPSLWGTKHPLRNLPQSTQNSTQKQ